MLCNVLANAFSVPAHEIRFRLSHNKNHSLMVQFKYSSSSLPVIIIINISITDATNTTHTRTHKMNLPLVRHCACVDFPVPECDKSLLTKRRCIPVDLAHTRTAQLRPYPCSRRWACIGVLFEHDSIENALAPMLDAVAARDVVWALDRIRTRAIRVNWERTAAAHHPAPKPKHRNVGWIASCRHKNLDEISFRFSLHWANKASTSSSWPLKFNVALVRRTVASFLMVINGKRNSWNIFSFSCASLRRAIR